MAVKLSPFGPNPQWVDGNGDPAVGHKLFFHAAGSSTKQNTYTDSTGNTANANPIVLNALGQSDTAIWFTEGLDYKAVLAPPSDTDPPTSAIWSRDDLSGINDASISVDQWVASGLTPTYVSATSFTLVGDQTTAFHVGRRLKSTVTAGTAYSTITASAYGALTTITVVNDSGSALDSGLSAVSYGLPTSDNTSIPVIKDSDFRISGSSDKTKKAAFEVDTNVTTATTVTTTLQNRSGTIGLVEGQLFPVSAAVAANAITFTLNPCSLAFRSATLGSGTVNVRHVNTAITTVLSSGSTAGSVSGSPSRIMIIAIDNAGSVELACCNGNGSVNLDESTIISTISEGGGGGADSDAAIYSSNGRSNVPFRVVGYVDSTQATAGTWATAPSTIQGWGGVLQRNGWTYLAEQASTSGTSIDFTGISPFATEIEIFGTAVSTNGTSDIIAQIGDAGGIESASYESNGESRGTAPSIGITNYTAGYGVINGVAAAVAYNFSITLKLANNSTNKWFCEVSGARVGGSTMYSGIGTKSLSAMLDRIRITTAGGANTFDAGTIGARYKNV
jgi:hypothetical protein